MTWHEWHVSFSRIPSLASHVVAVVQLWENFGSLDPRLFGGCTSLWSAWPGWALCAGKDTVAIWSCCPRFASLSWGNACMLWHIVTHALFTVDLWLFGLLQMIVGRFKVETVAERLEMADLIGSKYFKAALVESSRVRQTWKTLKILQDLNGLNGLHFFSNLNTQSAFLFWSGCRLNAWNSSKRIWQRFRPQTPLA